MRGQKTPFSLGRFFSGIGGVIGEGDNRLKTSRTLQSTEKHCRENQLLTGRLYSPPARPPVVSDSTLIDTREITDYLDGLSSGESLIWDSRFIRRTQKVLSEYF